jgi:hypothetical protein
MKKNTLINLALLLVVVALALVATYEPGIDKPAEKPLLVKLERDKVNHIQIQRDGQKTVELKRNAKGKWQLLQPTRIAASDFRIDSLLRITDTKSLGTFAADKEKLADYQLDRPKVTLTLNDTTKILFGTSTPLDHRRYVLFNNKVHLISDALYYHLIGDWPTFVRKKPLPDGASIESLKTPELALLWQDKRWHLDPKPEKYSADQVTRLLDNWKLASAIQVKVYDGRQGDPVTLQLKGDDQPLTLLVTARKPDLVLARPDLGIEYHFPEESAGQMLTLPPQEKKDEKKADGVK